MSLRGVNEGVFHVDRFSCSGPTENIPLRGLIPISDAMPRLASHLLNWWSMIKRILSLVLIGAITIAASGTSALAAEANAKEAASTEEMKAAIAKLGTGPSAHVKVTLRDKSRLQGYILKADEEHFVLVHEKTGVTTEVAYPQVKQVKGHNLSTGAKVAIGVGIGIVILLIVLKDRITSY